jgi:hypothetical protein
MRLSPLAVSGVGYPQVRELPAVNLREGFS